jgi:hypothetical protein
MLGILAGLGKGLMTAGKKVGGDFYDATMGNEQQGTNLFRPMQNMMGPQQDPMGAPPADAGPAAGAATAAAGGAALAGPGQPPPGQGPRNKTLSVLQNLGMFKGLRY